MKRDPKSKKYVPPGWGKPPPRPKMDPVVELPESEEDKKFRLDGEEYARVHAAEFCAVHAKELNALISTYPDGEAEDLFEELRERFWARLWKPQEPSAP